MKRAKWIFGIATAITISPNVIGANTNEKPNVVIIYVDDLGYGDLSCYGATEVKTPNVDKLAAEGVMFTDGHCSASTCTPSRYSLLTGSYAFRNNAAILEGDAPLLIDPNKPTLPSMLKKNGYATAVIGKWHLGLGSGNPDWNGEITPGPREIGFDYSYLVPATGDRVPCVMVENQRVVNLDPYDPLKVSYGKKIGNDPTGKSNPELLKYGADGQHNKTIVNGVSRIGYMTGGNAARWKDETIPYLMLSKARKFIDENKDKPFFLYFAFLDIHVPRMPSNKFEGKSKLGVRGDAILQMDYITGELIKHLKEAGVASNTLVIFSSDNGPVLNDGYDDKAVELLGNHKPAGPYRGGKYSSLEAGTRVPTIAWWPGRIQHSVSNALMGHVDLYASIASLINYNLVDGEAPDSYNILDAILGKSQVGRDYLLEESYTLGIRKGNYKYIRNVKEVGQKWIEENKGIESGLSTEEQLYDLSSDEGEVVNIFTRNKRLAKKMEKEIERIESNPQSR